MPTSQRKISVVPVGQSSSRMAAVTYALVATVGCAGSPAAQEVASSFVLPPPSAINRLTFGRR